MAARRVSNIVRWIAALPAAAVCGYLAYLVGGFVNNVSLFLTLVPLEGWLKVIADVMAHMYMGAAFVFCAVRFAPSSPKYVAATAQGIVLIFGGVSLWSSFVIDKYYAVPTVAGVVFGGVAALLGTLAGEIVPYGAGASGRNRSS